MWASVRRSVLRAAPRVRARTLSTEAHDAFVIPEEPIQIEHADAKIAREEAQRQRHAAALEDVQGAESAAERLVRKMRRTMRTYLNSLTI